MGEAGKAGILFRRSAIMADLLGKLAANYSRCVKMVEAAK